MTLQCSERLPKRIQYLQTAMLLWSFNSMLCNVQCCKLYSVYCTVYSAVYCTIPRSVMRCSAVEEAGEDSVVRGKPGEEELLKPGRRQGRWSFVGSAVCSATKDRGRGPNVSSTGWGWWLTCWNGNVDTITVNLCRKWNPPWILM